MVTSGQLRQQIINRQREIQQQEQTLSQEAAKAQRLQARQLDIETQLGLQQRGQLREFAQTGGQRGKKERVETERKKRFEAISRGREKLKEARQQVSAAQKQERELRKRELFIRYIQRAAAGKRTTPATFDIKEEFGKKGLKELRQFIKDTPGAKSAVERGTIARIQSLGGKAFKESTGKGPVISESAFKLLKSRISDPSLNVKERIQASKDVKKIISTGSVVTFVPRELKSIDVSTPEKAAEFFPKDGELKRVAAQKFFTDVGRTITKPIREVGESRFVKPIVEPAGRAFTTVKDSVVDTSKKVGGAVSGAFVATRDRLSEIGLPDQEVKSTLTTDQSVQNFFTRQNTILPPAQRGNEGFQAIGEVLSTPFRVPATKKDARKVERFIDRQNELFSTDFDVVKSRLEREKKGDFTFSSPLRATEELKGLETRPLTRQEVAADIAKLGEVTFELPLKPATSLSKKLGLEETDFGKKLTSAQTILGGTGSFTGEVVGQFAPVTVGETAFLFGGPAAFIRAPKAVKILGSGFFAGEGTKTALDPELTAAERTAGGIVAGLGGAGVAFETSGFAKGVFATRGKKNILGETGFDVTKPNFEERFLVQGQERFLKRRVQPPNIFKPTTIVDKFAGRKPGQFAKFQKDENIQFLFQEIPPGGQNIFAGERFNPTLRKDPLKLVSLIESTVLERQVGQVPRTSGIRKDILDFIRGREDVALSGGFARETFSPFTSRRTKTGKTFKGDFDIGAEDADLFAAQLLKRFPQLKRKSKSGGKAITLLEKKTNKELLDIVSLENLEAGGARIFGLRKAEGLQFVSPKGVAFGKLTKLRGSAVGQFKTTVDLFDISKGKIDVELGTTGGFQKSLFEQVQFVNQRGTQGTSSAIGLTKGFGRQTILEKDFFLTPTTVDQRLAFRRSRLGIEEGGLLRNLFSFPKVQGAERQLIGGFGKKSEILVAKDIKVSTGKVDPREIFNLAKKASFAGKDKEAQERIFNLVSQAQRTSKPGEFLVSAQRRGELETFVKALDKSSDVAVTVKRSKKLGTLRLSGEGVPVREIQVNVRKRSEMGFMNQLNKILDTTVLPGGRKTSSVKKDPLGIDSITKPSRRRSTSTKDVTGLQDQQRRVLVVSKRGSQAFQLGATRVTNQTQQTPSGIDKTVFKLNGNKDTFISRAKPIRRSPTRTGPFRLTPFRFEPRRDDRLDRPFRFAPIRQDPFRQDPGRPKRGTKRDTRRDPLRPTRDTRRDTRQTQTFRRDKTTTVRPPINVKNKRAVREVSRGFDVFLKRRGKFKKISKRTLTREAAFALGARAAVGGLGRTFKLEKTRKLVRGPARGSLVSAQVREQFRGFKLRKGTRIPTPDIFIQKRGTTLGTRGERREIQRARKRSKKKKK